VLEMVAAQNKQMPEEGEEVELKIVVVQGSAR
jgi:hypothetical protein